MEISINTKTLRIIGIVFVSIIALVLIQVLVNNRKADANCEDGVCGVTEVQEEKITAEKIELIHFHSTQQCWSCTTVGDFTEKSLNIRFPNEIESGKIVFKSINYELPENKEITEKYKAYGSSLFINLIYDGKDHISEDVQVWRLVNSELQFREYLGDKLEKYL